jgi:hypothetical protein
MSRSVLKWEGGVIEFDAVEVEEMSHDAAITSYPVEYGVDLVDHIRVEPISVRLTAYVSNQPAREMTAQMDGVTSTLGVDIKVSKPLIPRANLYKAPTSFAGVPLTYESTVRAAVRLWGAPGNPVRRVANVYAELRNGMTAGRIYTLASDMGDYDNMAIKSLSIRRDAGQANAPRFDIDLQQVSFALLSTREIPARPKKPRSKRPKDEGRKQAEPADKQTEKETDTLLHGIKEAAKKAIFG